MTALADLEWRFHSGIWETAEVAPERFIYRTKVAVQGSPKGALGYYPDKAHHQRFISDVHPLVMQALVYEWLKEARRKCA